jgi:ribonuclease T1
MNRILFFSLVAFCAVSAAEPGWTQRHQRVDRRAEMRAGDIPQRAIDVYQIVIETGRAPEGFVGGRTWENREHRLPSESDYKEFDVNPKVKGKNRGAERIVVDMSTKKGWYTGDHYRTFIPIPKINR